MFFRRILTTNERIHCNFAVLIKIQEHKNVKACFRKKIIYMKNADIPKFYEQFEAQVFHLFL